MFLRISSTYVINKEFPILHRHVSEQGGNILAITSVSSIYTYPLLPNDHMLQGRVSIHKQLLILPWAWALIEVEYPFTVRSGSRLARDLGIESSQPLVSSQSPRHPCKPHNMLKNKQYSPDSILLETGTLWFVVQQHVLQCVHSKRSERYHPLRHYSALHLPTDSCLSLHHRNKLPHSLTGPEKAGSINVFLKQQDSARN